jgi:phosphoglycolate phosphatase-like HAD superfamily hydrolase
MGLAAILDVDGTLVDTNYHHAIAHGSEPSAIRASRCRSGGSTGTWAWAATKPAPDLVEVAIRKTGLGQAVMIGDSTWDCRAVARAGIQTIAVLTGGFSEQELGEAGALAVFDSLPALSRHLDQTPLR